MKFKPFYAFAFLILFTFVSCDNEPLEGEFVVDDPTLLIPEFKAEIEDFTFVADVATAETVQGVTTITGTRSNGDVINLRLNGAGVGAFNMVSQGEAIFGINVSPEAFSSRNQGGSGQVVVTQYDTQLGVISGTFFFTATRPLLNANGQPILDVNGNPTFDQVVITEGEFNNIALVTDGSTGGDNPTEFYADVDGLPFVAGSENAGAIFIEATNTLVIQGNNNNRNIQINIVDPEPGTYDLGAASEADTRATYTINGQDYSTLLSEGGLGTVTITSINFENNKVSGTFSFEAGRDGGNQTVSVTNGVFTNINIEGDIPGNLPESDFYADIDGEPFTPGQRLANYYPDLSSVEIEGIVPFSVERIRLIIQNPVVGTFAFEMNSDTRAVYLKPGTFAFSTSTYPDGEGSVTINTFDIENNLISGTFEFIAFNENGQSVEVTNGSFNIVNINIL